ncbi:MAG: hypothetical protein JWN84_3050 [Nocardioides sp.]|nr:hypothetical protein [Nocardioides sp.]
MMRRGSLPLMLATSALALSAAPAHAEGEPLGLSYDSVTWSDSLGVPLFDPDVRWVPGDVRTARFFVRNQQPDAGDLSVVIERAAQRDLVDSGWLAISARAGSQPWTTVSDGGRHQLVDRDRLRPGVPLEVVVRVAMNVAAPNRTMVLSTDLDFTVSLTDSDAVLDAGEGAGDGVDGEGGAVIDLGGDGAVEPEDSGPVAAGGAPDAAGLDPVVAGNSGDFLPGTGSEVPPWLPPLGLALLGTGTYLVVRRRDRDADPVAALH